MGKPEVAGTRTIPKNVPPTPTPTISDIKPKPTSSTGNKHDRISFENENDGGDPKPGSYLHYRKKMKSFYYEDIYKGSSDDFYHVDVGTECDAYFRGKKVQYKHKNTEIFYHVVDLDAFEYHKVVFHNYLNSVLQSAWFRFLILALVMLSALMIGLTTFKQFEEHQWWFKIVDQVILSVFIFEIVVKWMYDFRLFWKVSWNILDFVIVAVIIITAIFPITSESDDSSKALVIVRVVRAFRSLKSISSLSSLTIVTHTVVKSGKDMGNILLVLIIFMLVMAVMGVILFDLENLRTQWFVNALNAWYLLFICVTQDGWNAALDEFRQFKDHFALLAIYLIFAVSVGAFVFANLIVAVIVANLELSVKERREEQILSDDPLDTEDGFVINELEITPTYDLFAKHNLSLLAQRPMKIPTFRHFSLRRLQIYIQLIVALEQNMLESEIIRLDFEKMMAVLLSVVTQLNVYSGPMTQKSKEEGQEVVEDLKKMAALEKEDPKDAINDLEYAAYATQFKKKMSS